MKKILILCLLLLVSCTQVMIGWTKGGSGPGVCFQHKKSNNKTDEYICYEGRQVTEQSCLDYDFGDGSNLNVLFEFYTEFNCDQLCNRIYNRIGYDCKVFNTNGRNGLTERAVSSPYPKTYKQRTLKKGVKTK